jgi:hypothetical protein
MSSSIYHSTIPQEEEVERDQIFFFFFFAEVIHIIVSSHGSTGIDSFFIPSVKVILLTDSTDGS